MQLEIEELACLAMGKTETEADFLMRKPDADGVDGAVYDAYGVDFEAYADIVLDLLKFTPLIQGPLTGKQYHAFVDIKTSRAIIKLEIQN